MNEWSYFQRGKAYFYKKSYDEGIADYTKAIELNQDWANPYTDRGNAYYEKKLYDLAIADETKAIELKPDLAFAYNVRGRAYLGKKLYDEALADEYKAISIDPTLAYAYKNRANVWAAKKLFDLAIADATKAVQLNPNLAEGYYSLAQTYYSKGQDLEGLLNANEAVRLATPDDNSVDIQSAIYEIRGEINERMGKNEKAIADYRQSLSLNPSMKQAEDGLKRLEARSELIISRDAWPSFASFWFQLLDPDNRAVYGWIGSGIVVVFSGLWAVIKFVASRSDKP